MIVYVLYGSYADRSFEFVAGIYSTQAKAEAATKMIKTTSPNMRTYIEPVPLDVSL